MSSFIQLLIPESIKLMHKNVHLIKGVLFLFALFIVSSILPYLQSHDPLSIDLDTKFIQPSLQHFWGTDELGRDVFSRVLYGFSTSLRVSIFALLSSLFIGVCLGGIAGYWYDTWIDSVFNWFVSLIFSLPFLLIMAAIMSIAGPGIINAYIILSLIMWVGPARITRAEVIKTKNLNYIVTARAYGYPGWRILLFIILPNTIESAFTFSISYLPEIVGLEAGLSFLGLGVQPPHPGLGKMIFDGLNYIYIAWWLTLFPAMILFVVVMLINLFMMWSKRKNMT